MYDSFFLVIRKLIQGADDLLAAKEHFKVASQVYQQLCEREERLSEEEGMELPVLQEWRRNIKDLTVLDTVEDTWSDIVY